MRKLLVATLLVKLVCLQVLCQPLSVLAESGSGGGSADECAADPTKYSLDANGDEAVDLSDVIWSLSWMFSGGLSPQVCLDSTALEANPALAERERDVAQAALGRKAARALTVAALHGKKNKTICLTQEARLTQKARLAHRA